MKKILSVFACLFFLMCNFGYARDIVDLFPEYPGTLFFWTEAQSSPRPLKIHFLMVDLTSGKLEVIAMAGDDPDGMGPAESQLTEPSALLDRFKAIAAVNANAFAGIGKNEASHPDWHKGLPVNIHGMVVSRGKTVSPVEAGRTTFWLDEAQKPHLGDTQDGASVKEAVADWFSPLIVNSKIIPDTSDSSVHPRTALGFDNSGKWLLLVVVDGRQPGYSEGVTLYELAGILKARGCTQSINLDGGGSSIMLIRDNDNGVKALNQPSDGDYRPVPVMLGIRKK